MAESASKHKQTKTTTDGIVFRCRRCGQAKPLTDMRSITRFLPVLIVCKDCARELR